MGPLCHSRPIMPFTLSPLHDTIGVCSTNALIEEVTTFVCHLLPPILCYFVMAVLAIMPQTRTIRLVLCLVMVLLTLRAAFPMDISLKITERKFHHNLVFLQVWMFVTTAGAISWTMARKPPVRQLRPVNSTPSTLMDALDLVSNFRGYGWDWSRGVHFPRETRPSNHGGFIFYTILSAAAHAFAFGILNTAIRSFSLASFGTLSGGPILDDTRPFLHRAIRVCFPVGHGDISGGSIFDESLPLHLRFLRLSVISTLAFVWIYVGLQMLYDSCTILSMLILEKTQPNGLPSLTPRGSPPLTDFWGRRWHQLLRRTLLVLGGYPLSSILGRAGTVIRALLASAVFHHVELTALNSNSEFWRILVGFGMMALGIIMEDVFKDVTGRTVRGLAGWVWTMGWIVLWGNVMVDAFARAGSFGFPTPIDLVLPVRKLVEYPVTEFDNLLRAIPSVLVAWNITIA
ncbi:hypothetical protein OG21DRAFT_1501766 [Imleria badia]|nr:hypothetical protein OG21DRAFT_1501766 [Imleria badia]